jgi:DNA-binding transcriptional LysR family regulator
MALNFHLMRLFAAVARLKSFSKAAETLHISQPAVSKGVREFEAQIGAALFERSGGSLKLTEAGELLARYADGLFASERVVEQELAMLRGLRSGSLSVGASTTIATYLLPSILGAFHQAYPGVRLKMTSANTKAIAKLLLEGDIEIALVEGPVSDPHLRSIPWRRDHMVLIVSPSHPLALLHEPIDISALSNQVWILREPGSGSLEVVLGVLKKYGIQPSDTLELGSSEAIKQAVAAKLGVAIVSGAVASDQIALGKLKAMSVKELSVHRLFAKLVVDGRRPSAAARALDRYLDSASSL